MSKNEAGSAERDRGPKGNRGGTKGEPRGNRGGAEGDREGTARKIVALVSKIGTEFREVKGTCSIARRTRREIHFHRADSRPEFGRTKERDDARKKGAVEIIEIQASCFATASRGAPWPTKFHRAAGTACETTTATNESRREPISKSESCVLDRRASFAYRRKSSRTVSVSSVSVFFIFRHGFISFLREIGILLLKLYIYFILDLIALIASRKIKMIFKNITLQIYKYFTIYNSEWDILNSLIILVLINVFHVEILFLIFYGIAKQIVDLIIGKR